MDKLLQDHKFDNLCEELFPDSVKTMVATNIYAACTISKNLRDSMINMPMRASWIAGHSLAYFIDKLLTGQIDNSTVGKFPYDYRETRIPKCGYPYMEYYSPKGKFHIKKVDKEHRLPTAAVHRISNSLANTVLLNYGSEYTGNVPFALITFGHKRLDLSFIELGFPKPDYSDWADYWGISDKISKELAEEILLQKEPELKEEYQEKIVKRYELKLKGE